MAREGALDFPIFYSRAKVETVAETRVMLEPAK